MRAERGSRHSARIHTTEDSGYDSTMNRSVLVRAALVCAAGWVLLACGEPRVTPDPVEHTASTGEASSNAAGPESSAPVVATASSSAAAPAKASLDETIKAVDGKDPAPLLVLLGFPAEEVKALSATKALTNQVSKLEGNFDADPEPEMAVWVEAIAPVPPMAAQRTEMVVFFDGVGPGAKPLVRDSLKLEAACDTSFEVKAEKVTSAAVDSVVGRSILTFTCDGRNIAGRTGIVAWSSQEKPRILFLEEDWEYDRAGMPPGRGLTVDVSGAPPKTAKITRAGKVKKQLKYDAKEARYK